MCVCVCACASARVCTHVYLRSACITASTESQITAKIIQGTSCARLCMCACACVCVYVYTYVDVVPVSVTPIAGSVIGGVVGVQILIVVISVFIVLQNRGKVIIEIK